MILKILYGIQGTGNGHISRAFEIIPELEKYGQVDILISGLQSELKLPFDVKYSLKGLGFVFGKKGGIDLISTYKKNKIKRFFNEVKSLDVSEYELVISDFEPVTAWACIRQKKFCLGLSNQAALLNSKVPLAESDDFVGKFLIKHYAPCTSYLGISYKQFDKNIVLPVIRKSVRQMKLSCDGHYTVYLPAYSDKKILDFISIAENIEWHIFSKNTVIDYSIGSAHFHKLSKEGFEQSFASCAGIITAAGFGTTSEALFMGKKMLVIPQKNQFEQACNAEALSQLGITVIKSIKAKHQATLLAWINNHNSVKIDYPDSITETIKLAMEQWKSNGFKKVEHPIAS